MKWSRIVKWSGIVAAAAMAAVLPFARTAHAGGASDAADIPTGEQVLEGEIIDLDCYLLDPVDGRGPEHNECARHCLTEGKPCAFMVGDRLYMIIGAGQAVSHEDMARLAGFDVKLTGNVVVQNGIAFIFLEGVEPVGPVGNTDATVKE